MLPAQSPATWMLEMQPPQDVENIAKRNKTFEPDFKPSKGIWQVGVELKGSTSNLKD